VPAIATTTNNATPTTDVVTDLIVSSLGK